jgi:hypothetical protein
MRLLLTAKEREEFRKEFPGFKWDAGDTKIAWNSNNPEEVEMARQAFNAYKKKHPKAMAFRVKKDDVKDTQEIKEFDPNAELLLVQDWMHKG